MKILVTGGAGFIGSHVAERYWKLGHSVLVIDDLSTGNRANLLTQEIPFFKMSINCPDLKQLLERERPDVVNHHAAQIDVRRSAANPSEDAQINILGTLNLLEACRCSRVKKVVFASTGGAIYGEQDRFPADESHQTHPLSPYGIAKLTVEKYLQFYHEMHGISFVALRYANVYGPLQNSHGESGVIAIFTEKLLKGKELTIYGDGKQTRDYVYIEDVVYCNVRALEGLVQGIFNVGTGIETDVNMIAKELIQITGCDVPLRYSSARVVEQRRSCLKLGALQKIPPTPLSEGLRKTVEWFKLCR